MIRIDERLAPLARDIAALATAIATDNLSDDAIDDLHLAIASRLDDLPDDAMRADLDCPPALPADLLATDDARQLALAANALIEMTF